MIRALVVDDLRTAQRAIQEALEVDPEFRVVGFAVRGEEAVAEVMKLRPDVVLMDIRLPGGMDGFEAARRVLQEHSVPIVMVTASYDDEEMLLKRSLEAGALDVLPKPPLLLSRRHPEAALCFARQVKVLCRVRPTPRRRRVKPPRRSPASGSPIVAVASSTGGPSALSYILSELPPDFPAGVVVVQHMAKGFIEGLAASIDERCPLEVRVGEEGDEVAPGVVLFAPDGVHMAVDGRARVRLRDGPPLRAFRPSADILLSSVAEARGPRAVGVILTGMLDDGARGIKAIRDRGGRTIAQETSTCVVASMPQAAIALDAVDEVIPLERIAEELVRTVREVSDVSEDQAGPER